MIYLKADTATEVLVGPAVAVGDGFTPVTNLVLTSADEAEIIKHNGATALTAGAVTNALAAITGADGYYTLELTTSETDTEGFLHLVINDDSLILPIRHDFMVVNANVYDSLFAVAATDYLQVDTLQLAGTTQDATDLADFAAAGYDPVTNKVEGVKLADTLTTYTGNTVQTGDSFARIGAGGAGLTAVPWNASWDAEVESEVSDGLTAFWTSPATLIDLVWDEALTGATHDVANSAGRRLRQVQESAAVYGGFIWIDTVNGSAGTTDYENGTSDSPVNTIADANTLASSLGISRFKVAPGSSITFTTTQSGQLFEGVEWTLALGGVNVAGSIFIGAVVSGTAVGADPNFVSCEMGTVTLAGCRMSACRFTGTITMSAAADYYFDACYSGVAGAGTPTIDFGAAVANSNLSMRHYSGGVTINNKDNTGTDNMSLEGNGQLVVAASSSGAISLRGNFAVTNTGGATITYDDNTQGIADIEVDTQAIEVDTQDIQGRLPAALVGGKMDSDVTSISGSAAAADRLQLSALQVISGQCEATPSTTVIQTDLAETQDDIYIGRIVIFTSGAAQDEATEITDYTGSTGTLTVTALANAPAATDTFIIL